MSNSIAPRERYMLKLFENWEIWYLYSRDMMFFTLYILLYAATDGMIWVYILFVTDKLTNKHIYLRQTKYFHPISGTNWCIHWKSITIWEFIHFYIDNSGPVQWMRTPFELLDFGRTRHFPYKICGKDLRQIFSGKV